MTTPSLRHKGLSKYSVALLQLDLKKDPVILLAELLRAICHDFAKQSGCTWDTWSEASNHTIRPYSDSNQTSSSPLPLPNHLIVARLNVLVLLSNRLSTVSRIHSSIRPCILRAVFYVLRLVLWSRNRSVRCAALRCLRYYLHSGSDVRLFLQSQLDLMVARCLDLSYAPASHPPSARADDLLPTELARSKHERDSSSELSSGQRRHPFNLHTQRIRDTKDLKNLPVAWSRLPIHPKQRHSLLSGSTSKPKTVTFASKSNNLPGSTSLPSSTERYSFLRLIYHLVRLAPHLFPSSLLQAIAAPCLRAGRLIASGDSDSFDKNNPRDHQPPQRCFPIKYSSNADAMVTSCNLVTRDVAIRGCLLILTELLILVPRRMQLLTSCGTEDNCTSTPKNTNPFCPDHNVSVVLGNCVTNVTIRSLLSAFAVSPTSGTMHPPHLLQSICLVLLHLINSDETASLLPVGQLATILSPLTSTCLQSAQQSVFADSYISSVGCAKLFLLTMLQSWSGLFYFLGEGLPCLRTLMYSLAVGTTEMRNLILEFLFNIFPSLPTLHPSINHLEAAILSLSEALTIQAPNTLGVLEDRVNTESIGASSMPPRSLPGGIALTRRQPPSSAWNLTEGFVASEGCRLFSHCSLLSGSTIDLVQCHTSLLLATLIQAGLCEGLMGAISDANKATSTRAGLLLGFVAHKASTLLPYEHPVSRRVRHIGTLQPHIPGSRMAVLWLDRVHRVMHAHEMRHLNLAGFIRVPFHSPFLECFVHQTMPHTSNEFSFHTAMFSSLSSSLPQSSEAWIDLLISQSNVIQPHNQCSSSLSRLTDVNQWDWDVLLSLGRCFFNLRSEISWEEKIRMNFLHLAMGFITPSAESLSNHSHHESFVERSSRSEVKSDYTGPAANSISARWLPKDGLAAPSRQQNSLNTKGGALNVNFSPPTAPRTSDAVSSSLALLPHTWCHAPSAAIFTAGLISHLAIYPTTCTPGLLLAKFLSVIHDSLSACLRSLSGKIFDASREGHQTFDLFHPDGLTGSCVGLLLLAVGRLTSTEVGETHLESSGLSSLFLSVFKLPISSERKVTIHQFLLAKLLLSALHFTRPGCLSQKLLTAAVESNIQSIQLYTIRLMRLLFRLRVPLDATWIMDLISKLCLHSSSRVSSKALQLLEETCSNSLCLQRLTHLVLRDTLSEAPTTPSDLLTPLGFRLLRRTVDPVGHRIFGHVLSQTAPFRRVSSCMLPPRDFVAPVFLNSLDDESSEKSLLDYLLFITQSRLNVAYVADLENRLNELFIRSMTQLRLSLGSSSISRDWLRVDHNESVCPPKEFQDNSGSSSEDCSPNPKHLYRPSSDDFAFLEPVFTSTDSLFLSPSWDRNGSLNHKLINTPLSLPVPAHFYGCVAEHEDGFQWLVDRGYLETLLETLNTSVHALSSSCPRNPPKVIDTKAALWALAHICSSGPGQLWLAQQKSVFQSFQLLATKATTAGVRSTAWLCLNLIAFKLSDKRFAELAGSTSTGGVWITNNSPFIVVNTPTVPPNNTVDDHEILTDFTPSNSRTDFSISQVSILPSMTVPNGVFPATTDATYSSVPTVAEEAASNSNKFWWKALGKHRAPISRDHRRFYSRNPLGKKPLSSPMKSHQIMRLSTLPPSQTESSSFKTDSDDVNFSSSGRQNTKPAYESLTWSHMDLLFLNSLGRQPSDLTCDHARITPSSPAISLRSNCHHTTLAMPVYLPVDLSQLGHHILPSQTDCYPSSSSPQKSVNSLSTLLSSVRISSAAQSLLKHCDPSSKSILQDDTTVEVTQPALRSFFLPENTSERSCITCPKPLSFHHCDISGMQDHSTQCTDACSPQNALPPAWLSGSFDAFPPRCISRRCRRGNCARVLPTTYDTAPCESINLTRESWTSQLMDVISGFLSNMFSKIHERALDRLLCAAAASQNQTSSSVPPDPLFDACTYTKVAYLLATYTFPLESRVKIQSALSRLRIDELLLDAEDALTELEETIRQLPTSTVANLSSGALDPTV